MTSCFNAHFFRCIIVTLYLWYYRILRYRSYSISSTLPHGLSTQPRSLVLSLSMPATKLSARIQRRVQPIPPRPLSRRRKTAAWSRVTTQLTDHIRQISNNALLDLAALTHTAVSRSLSNTTAGSQVLPEETYCFRGIAGSHCVHLCNQYNYFNTVELSRVTRKLPVVA